MDNITLPNEPMLIPGDLAVDDRGTVQFVNGFDFAGVKRFYTVQNHRAGFIRAWHGHEKEAKYVSCLRGAAMVGVVVVDNWSNPQKRAPTFKWTLSGNRPAVVYAPPGHANGFKTLQEDTLMVFFSTATLEESREDDYRIPWDHWNIWKSGNR